jgi:hypothetical protein
VSGALFGDAFPAPGSGGTQDLTGSSDTAQYAMGTHFRVITACTATGVRWFCPTASDPTNPVPAAGWAVGLLRAPTGVGGTITWLDWNTGSVSPGFADRGTWLSRPFTAPVALSAGDECYVIVRTTRYAFSGKVFFGVGTVPGVDSRLSYVQDGGGFPNGAFLTGGGESANPPPWSGPSSFNSSFYGVDVDLAAPAGGSTERWGIPL